MIRLHRRRDLGTGREVWVEADGRRCGYAQRLKYGPGYLARPRSTWIRRPAYFDHFPGAHCRLRGVPRNAVVYATLRQALWACVHKTA